MMMNLYVGNLPYSVTEEQLRSTFAAYGEVSRVNLITDKFSGQSKALRSWKWPTTRRPTRRSKR